MINRLVTILVFSLSSTVFAAAPAESPKLLEKGKAAYTTNCTICHGEKGDGNGPAGAVMKPKPRNFMTEPYKGADGKGSFSNPTAAQVFEVIKSGVKGTAMAGYAHIPDEDKWGIAYYILKMRKAK